MLMKGSKMALLRSLLFVWLLIGLTSADPAEKDFEFAEEKQSFQDDEDFLADEAGSGSGEIATGVPALYRATINITSVSYSAEIAAAGRNIQDLTIVRDLEAAIQKLLDSLPGLIRVRIVSLSAGSLMVTFDIDTDGGVSQDDITKLLEETLKSGNLDGYRVSPDGFDFVKIRDEYTCSPTVGRLPEQIMSGGNNWANLMVSNAFPCSGYVVAWRFNRAVSYGSVYVGVFRQTSDTEFKLIAKTLLPEGISGVQFYEPDPPILVQRGDFIGLFHSRNTRGEVIARDGDSAGESQQQNIYASFFDEDIQQGLTFSITDFVNQENQASYAIQADMSYDNVPAVTEAPRVACTADEWTCRNLDCIEGSYRCDGQIDCYDASDEENCPVDTGPTCQDNEFLCQNKEQCLPREFVCNFVSDCSDNSDEVNCGPGRVRITAGRDSVESTSFILIWVPPSDDGQAIISYSLKYRLVMVRSQRTPDGDYIMDRPLTEYILAELPPTADRYELRDLQAGSYYEVEMSARNVNGISQPEAFIFKTAEAGCRPGQWQCANGECINVAGRCDSIPDCADRSDEENCGLTSCNEGLVACPQPDGTIKCVADTIGCVARCRETEFQCLDGKRCISFSSLCNGIVDCDDYSDEANCDCASGEFQCTTDRRCIPESRVCDNRFDCVDGSDEANCPCPEQYFTCLNTRNQECVAKQLVCDGANDCTDGSDEVNCPCAEGMFQCLDGNCVEGRMKCDGIPQCEDGSDEYECRTGCGVDQWQCADSSCIPERMRCDGSPQCEDSSDEENCPCAEGMFQCLDGNCVEGRMKCDGIPQCEDGSDEYGCPTAPPECPPSDFQCQTPGRLECIDNRLVCDGAYDCSDGSDENECPGCKPDEFTCVSDESCIPISGKCNGVIECADRSDELADCVCTDEQFRCGDGICIDIRRRCDRRVDCNDRSDEIACPCRAGEFQCSNGDCIDERERCDGKADCRDRSDESGCRRGRCDEDYFQCGTGHCLADNRVCDGYSDCPDASDEANCSSTCRTGEFECANGECVAEDVKCDGKYDCRDGSDEEGCPDRRRCPEGFFQCGTGHCLAENRVCDGYSDCPDASDEENCQRPLECEEGEMKCEVDKKCIPANQICNRVYDCSDGRDEIECQRCRSDEFQCEADRSCISRAGYCNGIRECSDGSDEVGCPTRPPISIEVSPRNLRIRQGAEAIITCAAQGLPITASLRWTRGNQGLPMQSAVEAGKLMIPVAKVEDSGDYTCSVVGVAGNYQDVARLEVVAIGPTPRPDDGDGRCGKDEAVCQNGQCIRREYRCDGEPDCADGSDEPADCFNNLCEPNEFKCPNGQCVMKIWRCDGEDDCSDGFDERNCAAKDPDAPCAYDEFQCISGDQCIPLAYQCDQEIDCLDRSDEIGCSAPVITVPPVGEIEVELGETFTILCEAIGVPTPLIVWRLNWGNIPSGERVTTVSQEGRGTLTITDVRYTDAGAYTCEAINNRGSIFAIPDALVIVRLSNLLISGAKRKEEKVIQKIVRIGGGISQEIIQEEKLVMIGLSGNCHKTLDVSVSGSIVYTECGGTKKRVVIEYVGPETVNITVIKQTVVLEKRGDQLPEPLKDEVFIYVGGLSEEVRQDVLKIRQITGITREKPATERKIIELGGHSDDYSQTKQIIIMGISQRCEGVLRLIPDRGRKLLQCLTNKSETTVVSGKTSSTSTKVLEKTVEITGSGPADAETISQREVVIHGSPRQELVERSQDIVLGKSGDEDKESVLIGKGPAGNEIVGKIIEITGGKEVNVIDTKKYVEIGSGALCNHQLTVSLTGSTVNCLCGNKSVHVEYVGEGPTDLEIVRHSFIIEGNTEAAGFQNQDFVMVYVGGIPEKMKAQTETFVVTEVYSAEEVEKQKQKVIEIGGKNDVSNRNQRQVVLIGVSRKCNRSLQKVLAGNKVQVHCAHTEDRSAIVVSGQGPTEVKETHERETIVVQGKGTEHLKPKTRENRTVVVEGKGVNEKGVVNKSETIVIQGQSSKRNPIQQQGKETIALQGKGTNAEEELNQEKETLVVQGQGPIETKSMTNKTERIVLQGKGTGVDEELNQEKEALVVHGQGPIETKVMTNKTERIVLQGKGTDADEELNEKKEALVVHGQGPIETKVMTNKTERVVLQGKGPKESVNDNRTVVLAGQTPVKSAESHESVVLHGKSSLSTHTDKTLILQGGGAVDTAKENKTVVVQGSGPVKKTNSVIVQGGRETENILVVQGRGPNLNETLRENKTRIFQGKGNDIIEPTHNKNKTIVLQGKSAEVQESEIRKESNKSVAIMGKGPEEVRVVQEEVTLIGEQENVVDTTTSTTTTTTQPDPIIETVTLVGSMQQIVSENEKEFMKVVLVGNHEYINLNQSHQILEVGTKSKCDGNIKVTSENNRFSFKCVNSEHGLDLVYLGKEDTDIEIKTHTRQVKLVEKQNKHDKIYIHLTGVQNSVNPYRNVVIPIRKNSNAVREREVFIDNINQMEGFISVVDVGIYATSCRNNSLGKYIDTNGTVVYCRRRADILPDEYDQELFSTPVKGSSSESVTLLGSHTNLEGSVERDTANLENEIDGEFMEVKGQARKELQIKVVSENVSSTDKGAKNAHELLRNDTKTFPASQLKVIGGNGGVSMDTDDDLPGRGDLSIQEYAEASVVKDEAVQHTVKSDTHEYNKESGVRRLDVEVNKTVDIKVGNDCTGKVEVLETDGNVIVKCTVGRDTFEINLVGLYQKGSDRLQDSPIKSRVTRHEGSVISSHEVMLKAKGKDSPNHLLIQQVEYASQKRYIRENGSESNLKFDHLNHVPNGSFMESITHLDRIRGDVPIDNLIHDKTAQKYQYQSDTIPSRDVSFKHDTELTLANTDGNYNRIRHGKRDIKRPNGHYVIKRNGIDMKFIDGKYDDYSISGFQHAVSGDFKKEVKRNYFRRKYDIPSLSGSRNHKKIKTLKGFGPKDYANIPFNDENHAHNSHFGRVEYMYKTGLTQSAPKQSVSKVSSQILQNQGFEKSSNSYTILRGSGITSVSDVHPRLPMFHHSDPQTMKGPTRNSVLSSLSISSGSRKTQISRKLGSVSRNNVNDFSTDILLTGHDLAAVDHQSVIVHGTDLLKGQKGPCTPPFFNFGALTSDECIRCFCFGHTVQCFSSELHTSRIALAGQMQFVRRLGEGSTPVEQRFVDFKPTTREFQVLDMTRALPTGSYYWTLPREFLGERLTSYGGELKYTVHYEIEGSRQSYTNDPDVIIKGNGVSLYYRGRTEPSPGIPTSISVPLIESAWERTEGPDRGDTPISEYASREDLMMVLENVESIMIRGVYDGRQTTTRIGGVFMTTAVDYPTELGRATLVEECTCPTGYTGASCQNCAPGFTRVESGEYLGQCISCNCNGHSNDCDRITGECLNCLHNTYGPECQLCVNGYYGDARRGTAQDCQPCPCPLTEASNQFSRTCFLDSDGDVTCANCPEGYLGRRCERCADGYSGDPMVLGSSCRKREVEDYCDQRGSLSTQPNPITRRCECKENVIGDRCDRCKANAFYLSDRYELGCVECFCMGVSRSCQSTSWNRAQIGLSFTRDEAGVVLKDSNGDAAPDQRYSVNTNNRELSYRFDGLPDDTYYWTLPSRFLGDKVTVYGGTLRFTVRYSSRQGAIVDEREPMVKISGNDITLVHRARVDEVQPNRPTPMSVQMFEQNWYRSDGQPATREHLLMTLADLDAIWIRASFEDGQSESGLRDVTLDVAEDRQTRQDRAYPVEQCVCPVGYRGLSCEDCDTGYTRSGGGLYLGLCEPCDCNGHSSECDPESGICRNCQHNTAGDYCDECAVGYYGDATRGTRNDCQPCPCPLTEAPNQFSPRCELAADGQVTCTACPAGHTGRRCESCLADYQGDPMRPGDYCKPREEDRCDCDSRGTIPNTQCDANTQECQCKPYVQGRRCARCREGHFYLEANNAQGCLTCFCSGITNQCTSSSYYRETIRPQVGSDGTHNFVLMNRRMNNIISDGFSVDASRNQVTFNGFEGVQRDRESLFFQLPPKFRGDQVASYGGYLRFTLEYTADQTEGRGYRDVDLEIISQGQALRLYYLFEPSLQEGKSQTYEILLREGSFSDLRSNTAPTRETFMTILSDIEGFLIRATHHQKMASVSIRDLSLDTAVPSATNLGGAPMVESCRCPEGYTGLSCQRCAQGYLRVSDGSGGLGRCVRCNCNGHATACDPDSGRCLNCQHNTEGDRCENCASGYYGDATSGTPQDCRPCPCPLTTPQNQFSRTCYLADDNEVTCDRCPTGYSGRRCEICAAGYTGNPNQPGGTCRPREEDLRPEVVVAPIRVEEPTSSSVVFSCSVSGQGPFNVVWSRTDRRPLPDRASVSPRYDLSIRDLRQEDSGRYECTATNAYGVTRRDVELKVIYGQSPISVEVDQTRVVLEEGRSARFVCTAYNAREMNYILSWSKQGSVMPSKAIEQNGVLLIPDLKRSDQGNYVCMGTDMFSEDSASVILIVEEGEEPAPTVRIEPRFQTVKEGEPVRFNCIATGVPQPTIEWYRGGNRQLNPEASVTSDGVFTIPRARPDDEADYYCKATNEAGTVELRTILYVTRSERPPVKVTVKESRVVTLVGQTARLECYSEAPSDRVLLLWSRQNAGLPPRSSQEEGILSIPNVQPSYSGNYVCTGTDTNTGIINTSVTRLDVQEGQENEAPTARVEPEKLTIPMGTTGTLRCIVTGSPAPKVTWLKSREDLDSNHQVNGNTLRITQATMGDRGIYVCRVENAAGSDQDWAVVEVERRMRPKIELYPNSTQRVRTGASAMFQCRVMDGDPPPTISWSRVGNTAMDPDKVEVMDNGVIMFKQTTSAEQGSYMCTATNDMGTISATASLIVEGPPSITLQPSKQVYALIGKRVTLECIAEGDPTPSVYWIEPSQPRRGDLAPDGLGYDVYEGSAVLDIASVGREDQGYYTCVATNSGGRTEDSLQLIVEEGGRPGVAIQGPSTLSVQEGQTVELVCSADAIRNPVIRWRRREGPLPPDHRVSGGVLRMQRFRQEYAGEYICSTQLPDGNYEASVFIIVSVSPRLSVSPQRVTTRAGETIQLRCSPLGSGPFNIEWSKTEGQMNPRATERDGILEIRQVTAADAGRYRCTVTSNAGTLDGYSLVDVEVPPSVNVRQRDKAAQQGSNVELRCDATGSPNPSVGWTKEGGELPLQHRVQNGVLTIYNVQPEDRGRYICSATSSAGSDRDYTVLDVRTGPVIQPDGGEQGIDSQVVNVGDRVSMECIVTGTPLPTVTWSRDDGLLPEDAILGEGILIIPSAKIQDAGTYTCMATNEAGSVSSKFVLYVKVNPSILADESTRPVISAPQRVTSAALGDQVSLVCDASGYPSPDITWHRKDASMPDDYTVIDGDLLISRVRPEDAGTYVCSAANEYGTTDIPVELSVGALVPYFTQTPESYISYPPLNDVYLDFDMLLSVKPESTEGMVLYNGQFNDGGGDFVCFGLSEGYPEFRFDVGSGPAVIRGNKTLDLNQWHTVKLTRNRKKGTMIVNEQPAYTGESPGYFTGLDLSEPMYLGSVPNYDAIPRVAGFREGFVGTISEVKIKNVAMNLGAEALEVVGVEQYNACRDSPCYNNGACAPYNVKYGFRCMCPQGYAGERCSQRGESCYPGACGPKGRCYNLDGGLAGYRCVCPLGKTGAGCQMDVSVINPAFNRTSFISYPPAEDALFSMTLYIEFKPYSLRDGIIVYEGNNRDGSGDFMSIIQKDGYLEFRFDTGSGPAIIRSRSPLRVNEWTRVTVSRKNRDGQLTVNDDEPVTGRMWGIQGDDGAKYPRFYNYYDYKFKRYKRGTSPGSTVGLNLKLPMYLGGPDPTAVLSSNAGTSVGFIGCVAELQVNDIQIDLIKDAIESSNVVDCGERRLCERQPCENNAVCEDLPGPDYKCLCPATHTGKNCEVEINICLTNSPCRNGAACSITNEGYRCDCPLGFEGINCESAISLSQTFAVMGDGFVEFNKDYLPHQNTQERQAISFNIKTLQRDGLVFWQGEPGGRPLRGGDHFSIGLKGGYIEFSYEMGSGPAVIMSRQRVNDGQEHTIEVSKLGRKGTLTVDGGNEVSGESEGFLQMLNADGNIYIGGVSLIDGMTDGKYSNNFIGCIGNIVIQGKGPLELPQDAVQGFNVHNCEI